MEQGSFSNQQERGHSTLRWHDRRSAVVPLALRPVAVVDTRNTVCFRGSAIMRDAVVCGAVQFEHKDNDKGANISSM